MGRNLAVAEHRAPATPSHYVWSFPGSPVKVQLGLDVVERLQRQQRKGDIAGEQGLLLGRVRSQTTEISDFIAIPGSEPPDPNVIAALSPDLPGERGEPARVGYYRIQHGGSLRLNENDLSLAAAAFSDPRQVFLLIQLCDSSPANATFFFWDHGRISGDFPFLEFPFDASLLAAAERLRIEAAQQKALAKPAAVDPAPASDRQAPRNRTAFKTVFLMLAVGLVIFVLTSVIARGLFPKKASPIPITAPTGSPRPVSLGLQAERQRGDLKLTWDRASTLMARATSGVLSIQDGASKREIPLDSTLVRAGSLLYSPTTDQVQMQLTVVSPENTATETVIVVLPKVGPAQIQTTNVKTASVKNGPTSAVPRTAPESTASESRPLSRKLFTAPPLPVNREPVSRPVVVGEAPVLQPGFNPNAALPFSAITNFVPGPPPAPVNPAPGNPVAANSRQPVAAAPESPQLTSEYHPAEATRQEVPRIPATIPRPNIYSPISVEVKISIDKTGKVVKATAVPKKGAYPVLVLAAVDAARRWTFRPARIGDQPLASEMTIGFNFNPTH
jgi:protein TonB